MEPWREVGRGAISWFIFERKRDGFLEENKGTWAGSWGKRLEMCVQYTLHLWPGRNRFGILLIQEKFFLVDKWLGNGVGLGNREGGHLRKAEEKTPTWHRRWGCQSQDICNCHRPMLSTTPPGLVPCSTENGPFFARGSLPSILGSDVPAH